MGTFPPFLEVHILTEAELLHSKIIVKKNLQDDKNPFNPFSPGTPKRVLYPIYKSLGGGAVRSKWVKHLFWPILAALLFI